MKYQSDIQWESYIAEDFDDNFSSKSSFFQYRLTKNNYIICKITRKETF